MGIAALETTRRLWRNCPPKRLAVTVIALERGHDTKENCTEILVPPIPEDIRKALRQMKLAEKFHRPVVCFVDTAGAFCGIAAEERGQAQAMAENLYEMMTLKTPILSIFIGGRRQWRSVGPCGGRRGGGCWKMPSIR